jgi:hypothetical protein
MVMVALPEPAPIVGLDDQEPQDAQELLAPGTRVEVRKRFDAKWSRGFEVLEHSSGSYRLRRLSDGTTLPVLFAEDDVRTERRNNTWWI